MGLFFVVPLGILFIYSFMQRGLYGGIEFSLTLENYARVFDPLYFKPVLRSVVVSIITTVLCLVIGYPLAYYIARQPESRKQTLLVLIMLPFWTDFLVRTYAWMLILRTEGLLNTVLLHLNLIHEPVEILFTQTAVIIGLVYGYLPFMVLPLFASIDKLDPALGAAAQDLGATPLKRLWHVTLPLTRPGIIAGCILVFVPAFGAFITPDILGGAKNMMIGNLIKDQFLSARDWPFGSALSFIVMAIVMMLLYIHIRAGHEARIRGGQQ